MSELLHQFVATVVSLVGDMGYLGIFILMTVESSFIPFPSEIVLVPAGYLAQQGEMSIVMIFLAGVGGSLLGATINYYLSVWLGRKFILTYGRYFFLPEEKFIKLEKAFLKHGNFATFVGRLIFGIRQWISIPAGLARMPFAPFAVLTSLGASVWVIILVALGYVLGEAQGEAEARIVGYWLLGAVVIMTLAYAYWWVPKRANKSES
ncbi:MAG: DedA family protein [Candidatus Dadabacteria bacterium]|nr:MAG: DedA family protein [Candidatus Dadabacteria bacterium]